MQSRLPRFKRAFTVVPMQLEERDRQIIRLIYRHRFLRSDKIVALVGSSQQQVLRRLKLLYHHGYLERPRVQIESYYRPGSRAIAYGLGNRGGTLLKQELAVDFLEVPWNEKNHAVGRMFLEHALLVSDVMVAIELACRKHGNVRLLYEDELALPQKCRPFQWRVTVPGGKNLGVVPDRVFALEYTDDVGQSQRAYFFLEADRGTMPVMRHTLSQTSFNRKLLAYEATWTQNIHSRKLGIHRFRVVTVTTSAARVKSLITACSQLKRGHGLFLFADKSILAGDVFSSVWQTGKPGENGSLLD